MHSCLYTGFVRHRRFSPVNHEFRYSVFQLYIDLSELPSVFDPFYLWSARRPAVAWFRREDHLGQPTRPLDDCVRDEVQRQTGHRPKGPIRLLTNLRYFGYVMNPVSYYYCFDRTGDRLQNVLAEVHNTPWGERHCYVLSSPIRSTSGATQAIWNDKDFHVSPFMEMNMRYRWMMTVPGDRLAIHIENHVAADQTAAVPIACAHAAGSDGPPSQRRCPAAESAVQKPPFDVTLSLKRESITSSSLRRVLLRHPCMTASVTSGIYWQAVKLWWKGAPFVPHPDRGKSA